MRVLRRAIATAAHNPARRTFLRMTAGAGAALAIPSILIQCTKPGDLALRKDTSVAVVGGGLAGLNAARILNANGVGVKVYEASRRLGGRCLTSYDLLVKNTWVELGGEFIDSGHADMLALCSDFDLSLIDLEADANRGADTFFFHGVRYSSEDVATAVEPYFERIRADAGRLPPSLKDLANSPAQALDEMSLDAYLISLGVSGWLRSFLEVAFVTENGMELGEQSALNFLTIVSAEIRTGEFHPFGDSDERFTVRGGIQQITNRLADEIRGNVHTGHHLVRVQESGERFILTFRTGTSTTDVIADQVVLALPFTMLRDVQFDVAISAKKRRAIDTLNYGNNGKLLVGFDKPFWSDHGDSGTVLSDLSTQLVWNNTAQHGASGAGLTLFYGGSRSRQIGAMSKNDAAALMMEHLGQMWPYAKNITPDRVERMHWPSYPTVQASYSCYGPGQWTEFFGEEGASVGNLHFAGEHCSLYHKGYMNGAAETGRQAAEKILAAIA